jgi:hypothetical protein
MLSGGLRLMLLLMPPRSRPAHLDVYPVDNREVKLMAEQTKVRPRPLLGGVIADSPSVVCEFTLLFCRVSLFRHACVSTWGCVLAWDCAGVGHVRGCVHGRVHGCVRGRVCTRLRA